MVKPTLLQTLLRQPSQSYSHRDRDPYSDSSSRRSSSIRSGLSSSRRSGTSEATSEDSYTTSMSDPYSGSYKAGTGHWEWSVFGGRKGLTGGPDSLRAPSDIVRAVNGGGASGSVGGSDGDARSVRSSRSLGSVRSSSGLGNVANWSRDAPGLMDGTDAAKGKGKGKGTSRRYSDAPAVPPIPAPDSIGRRQSSLRPTPSPLSIPATLSSTTTLDHTKSSPELAPKRRKKRLEERSPVDAIQPPPSLSSSSVSTAPSSPPITPDTSLSSFGFSPPLNPAPVVKKKRRDREREIGEHMVLSRDGRRGRALASVDEGLEVAELEEIESPRVPAVEVPLQPIPLPRPPSPPTEILYVVASPALRVKFVEPRPVQDEMEDAWADGALPTATVAVVDAFAEPTSSLLDYPPPRVDVEGYSDAPELPPPPSLLSHPSLPSHESSPGIVPLGAPSDIPAPSTLRVDPPIVGKVYSMDELFSSLPLTPVATLPSNAAADASQPARPTSPITPPTTPRLHVSTAAGEPAALAPPSSPPAPDVETPSLKPLPASVLRLAHQHSASISSDGSSSIRSGTDISSPATELTPSEVEQACGNPAQSTSSTPPPTPLPPANEGAGVPRIRLTRTESDQAVDGLLGDVDADLKRTKSQPPGLPRKSSKRHSLAFPATTQVLYEVVASSTKLPKQPLTSANLASSSTSSAAEDTPEWLRNIRALGDPIPSLATVAGPASARRSKSMAVRPKPAHAAALKPMSGGSLRSTSPPPPPPAPSPAIRPVSSQEQPRATRSQEATPSSSVSGGGLSMASLTGEPTIPRRRTQSAIVDSNSLFPATERFDPTFIAPAPVPDTFGMCFPASFDPPRGRPVSVFSTATSAGGRSSSGLTTMSVPVGAYRPSKHPKRVSLGASRFMQTSSTMSALSISANASAALRRSGGGLFGGGGSRHHIDPHRPLDPARDFAFGSLQPHPKKLRTDEVLVEILAVGLDLWDLERAREMASRPEGFGWVPGRSFCGRAVECGVEATKIKRGDFVYGCQDLKKSGALAELMTVNRDLLALAPSCGISVEEIAALPAGGVLAVQVMEALCAELPKGSKILILNAHEGVGNLCLQLAFFYRRTRDLWVVAHCPPTLDDGEGYCRATGASDVICDEPLATLNSLHESSFDVVVDTIGGRRLYDAARRVLHFEGQYITTIGDSLSPPTTSTQWASGIRSLRRAFFPKDKKTIAYWAVNLDTREHPRDALDKLREAVEAGGVRPAVRRVVAFDRAAGAFDAEMGSGRVVKVVET